MTAALTMVGDRASWLSLNATVAQRPIKLCGKSHLQFRNAKTFSLNYTELLAVAMGTPI